MLSKPLGWVEGFETATHDQPVNNQARPTLGLLIDLHQFRETFSIDSVDCRTILMWPGIPPRHKEHAMKNNRSCYDIARIIRKFLESDFGFKDGYEYSLGEICKLALKTGIIHPWEVGATTFTRQLKLSDAWSRNGKDKGACRWIHNPKPPVILVPEPAPEPEPEPVVAQEPVPAPVNNLDDHDHPTYEAQIVAMGRRISAIERMVRELCGQLGIQSREDDDK